MKNTIIKLNTSQHTFIQVSNQLFS